MNGGPVGAPSAACSAVSVLHTAPGLGRAYVLDEPRPNEFVRTVWHRPSRPRWRRNRGPRF